MSLQDVQLEQLIRHLEAERGMVRKVRLLAGSWPLLRQLSPQQRERVALALGSRWALRNLEGMFGQPEKMSASQLQVKAIFERLRDADPDQLRRLGNDMKKGGVAGVRSRLLDALGEALEERIAAEDESQHPETAEPSISAKPPAAIPPPPQPPSQWLPPKLLEEPDELDEPDEVEGPTRPPAAKTETIQLALDSKRPAGAASEAERSEPQLEESSELLTLPRPAPHRPRAEPTGTAAAEAGHHPELEPEPLPSAVEPAELEEAPGDRRRRDTSTLSAVESLRALRRLSRGETAVSHGGQASRAALVGSLGPGWAARRAVSSMIRSRLAADLDEALALIRRLPSASQQTWCLGDLLQHWQLDAAALARVLGAAPTEAARSRLARRAARAV